MANTDLAAAIHGFFEQHLVAQRGLSAHTILAYRDALKQLLEFTCRHQRKTCVRLTLEDLSAETVRRYLNHLEQAKEQLTRKPHALPFLRLNPAMKDIFAFRFEDFTLENYQAHPSIKAPIAV